MFDFCHRLSDCHVEPLSFELAVTVLTVDNLLHWSSTLLSNGFSVVKSKLLRMACLKLSNPLIWMNTQADFHGA